MYVFNKPSIGKKVKLLLLFSNNKSVAAATLQIVCKCLEKKWRKRAVSSGMAAFAPSMLTPSNEKKVKLFRPSPIGN